MQTLTRPLVAATAILAVAGCASPAAAADLEFAAEIDGCLAAINERVDLQHAERVRHLVTEGRKTAIGYALRIESTVFSQAGERRYSARCLARGTGRPLRLRIRESS